MWGCRAASTAEKSCQIWSWVGKRGLVEDQDGGFIVKNQQANKHIDDNCDTGPSTDVSHCRSNGLRKYFQLQTDRYSEGK